MSRQPSCGLAEARTRSKVARLYLDVAELAADEQVDHARNVAAGNAVLAGIAASDAICCMELGVRHRGQDHQGAIALLTRAPVRGGLARDLATLLSIKAPAHYGDRYVSEAKLTAVLRAAGRLVDGPESAVSSTS